jgi:hypothetical protein
LKADEKEMLKENLELEVENNKLNQVNKETRDVKEN